MSLKQLTNTSEGIVQMMNEIIRQINQFKDEYETIDEIDERKRNELNEKKARILSYEERMNEMI